MELRRLAAVTVVILVACVWADLTLAAQKYNSTPPPPPKLSSSSNSNAFKPVPHDKPMRDHLAPSAPGAPNQGKENVRQGQKGILTPNFNAQVHQKNLPPPPPKKPVVKNGQTGTNQANLNNQPPALRTPQKDPKKKKKQPTQNAQAASR
jgi:hypothetical protein